MSGAQSWCDTVSQVTVAPSDPNLLFNHQHRIMKHLHSLRRVLALTVVSAAALLAACGGGETALTPAQSFVARIATETPLAGKLPTNATVAKRAAAAAIVITNDQLFQWVQLLFPELLGSAAPNVFANVPYAGKLFDVREYPGSAYLAISDGRVYALGPFTTGDLVDLGFVQSYSAQVCSLVNCAGGGSTGGGNGTLNGCSLPASQGLVIGNRYTAVYTSVTFAPQASSGEYTTEGVVEGNVTFEGQSAIKVSNRVQGTQEGQTIDATSNAFEQVAENELTRSLGSETVVSFAGMSLTSRTVNNPAVLNSEFTLQPGQSIDQTYSSTTTFINAPFELPPTTGSSTSRITYEARETISVLGRSYDTCRYKSTFAGDANTNSYAWYIVGKGFPARIESRNSAGTVLGLNELKSATINGAGI